MNMTRQRPMPVTKPSSRLPKATATSRDMRSMTTDEGSMVKKQEAVTTVS
jgi:hypothetical protein